MGIREENAKKAARRRFEARGLLHRLKSGPCQDCKQTYLPCQMDFIRRIDTDKAPVSKLLLRSQAVIIADIQKCDLLCANCGRLRTWAKQRNLRSGHT